MSDTQGQGAYTAWKERGIVAAGLVVSAKIFVAKGFHKKYPFWIFDLFAGSGYNDDAKCIGSPIAMLREALALGLYPRLHAVEKERDTCDKLIKRPEMISNGERAFVHHGDNAEFGRMAWQLVLAAREDPTYAMGVWLIDPNNSAVAPELLDDMARYLPRMDAIVNVAGNAIKRANGAGASKATIPEIIDRCRKAHWVIREPVGDWQWTLLIGRNGVPISDWPGMGFYRLDSAKGRDILETVTRTKREIRQIANDRLPKLF